MKNTNQKRKRKNFKKRLKKETEFNSGLNRSNSEHELWS